MALLAKSSTLSIGTTSDPLTLVGRSRAGDATAFVIPELKWMFDCGALIKGWIPKRVFVTHTHCDHVHYLTRVKSDVKNPTPIHLPQESASFVESYMKAYQEMTDCVTEAESQNGGTYPADYLLLSCQPRKEITFRQGGTDFIVRTLQMHHRIPCLGYSIFRKKHKLKEKYVGLEGKEIGKLRKEGVDVTDRQEEPLLCFMGDTTGAMFKAHPEVLEQHKVIVVECTFIDEGSVTRAETTKHMHWNDLEPYVANHPDVLFVLIHFSLKYSARQVHEFFFEKQKHLPNIHPMLEEEEFIELWKQLREQNRT